MTGNTGKNRTIASLFLRYIFFFAAWAVFWLLAVFFCFNLLTETGKILPANYMEQALHESASEIMESDMVLEEFMPSGSAFGVYGKDGEYLYGTFSQEDKASAWESYEKNNIYIADGGVYRFFLRRTGEICIVKYRIRTEFESELLRKYLPGPEVLGIFLYVVLFLLHTALLSRYFGKYVKKKLEVLSDMTMKIRNQDLEFEEEHSDLSEVNEVLHSLYRMKEALKESLYKQWDLERRKEEQIAALAHDIKTPLTVIRGNAELLAESGIGEDEKGYNEDILQSVGTMEEYLGILNEILLKERREERAGESMRCRDLIGRFEEQARILGAARHCVVDFCVVDGLDKDGEHKETRIICCENQMVRAFVNILNNAVDYNPDDESVTVRLGMQSVDEGKSRYLAVSVVDKGQGFSAQDLKHATEQFYRGDKSRNSKSHYGIGLHTAARFAEIQGGYVSLGNEERGGAKVTLYIRLLPAD